MFGSCAFINQHCKSKESALPQVEHTWTIVDRSNGVSQLRLIEEEEDVIFSAETKTVIIDKWIDETNRNKFFWQKLQMQVKQTKLLQPNIILIKPEDLTDFLSKGWGTIVLHSQPGGADVYLKRALSIWSYEGQTFPPDIFKKALPEEKYVFRIQKEGFKRMELDICIERRKNIERTVTLEKE